jgi:hypothetical protein
VLRLLSVWSFFNCFSRSAPRYSSRRAAHSRSESGYNCYFESTAQLKE